MITSSIISQHLPHSSAARLRNQTLTAGTSITGFPVNTGNLAAEAINVEEAKRVTLVGATTAPVPDGISMIGVLVNFGNLERDAGRVAVKSVVGVGAGTISVPEGIEMTGTLVNLGNLESDGEEEVGIEVMRVGGRRAVPEGMMMIGVPVKAG